MRTTATGPAALARPEGRGEPALEVSHLTTGYSGVPVVWDLSMTVQPGEVVALLGPNGAGKTTTLLTVSGFLRPLSGSICLHGEPTARMRPHRLAASHVAHVPEDRSLFADLTVKENLRLGRCHEKGRAAARQAYDRALELFPALAPLQDRRAGLLSGGEQQMLALARALVSDPLLLMVDELSLGLAPVIVEQLLPVVRRVADQTGAAVVLVEQHVQMALEIADRAYVLNHGRLVLSGDAADLRRDRGLLEASYLGDER